MEQTRQVLIVEDELNIADIIAYNLGVEGYAADIACDGQLGLSMALERDYDLILLDLMLPLMDGFEVCRRVRAVKNTPIIMLTAREDEVDKVMGLELGADDYITKPFSIIEVMARVKANIRRWSEIAASVETARPARSQALEINTDKEEVQCGGRIIGLTKKEYDLLYFLFRQPGKVFTREQLMKQVWGYDGFYGDERTVDVTVRRLRTKIEPDPANPLYIQSRRGSGYYFNEQITNNN